MSGLYIVYALILSPVIIITIVDIFNDNFEMLVRVFFALVGFAAFVALCVYESTKKK